jgi:YVTN family beta-propeller protein
MRALLAAAALTPLLACQGPARLSRALAPLDGEGELFLYLEPFAPEAERLRFSIRSIAAVRADGVEVQLELHLADLDATVASRQRLLASGRLPPGAYAALAVQSLRATLQTEEGRADLQVSPEPDRLPMPFSIERRKATVLSLSFRFAQSVSGSYGFAPAFGGGVPPAPMAALAGYCSSTGGASLAVFDRRRRAVVAVIPTGRQPEGLALDPLQRRGYVALSGEDQIEVLDLAAGEELRRIPMQPGDRPRELALTPDGRTLLSANPGSRTASILDAATGMEQARLPVGEEPSALLLDRSGRRAYVFNRRSASITAIDVGQRAVAGTLATEPEPLRGALNRAGTRLYVVHGGSAYLNAYALPELALADRFFVGLGATVVKVDPRTDVVYLGRRGERRLDLYDPGSFLPVGRIDLPGDPSWLAIDEGENTMLALLPEEREVAVVELTGRRVVARIEVGPEPYGVAVAGERN